MPFNCSRDCVGIRYRINSLHQTWKWLHQTIALHEYLISMSAADTNNTKQPHSSAQPQQGNSFFGIGQQNNICVAC
ncbi:uncharacterized protein LOC131288477 [Anopheles ziemanni]|uniref:uncharacterized protein LOC131261381 n=1 Tax=Anopheles coustani TaxID=139045 RepID=UPI00265AA8B4|nr:uncharacterized protein LOC131261381 [Anopheles coustani]XP_058173598.1 uncharacterized protein LOC131288477 [Anopheles ziemanni]